MKVPIVIHTRDLEPITVVELAEADIRLMHERGGARVLVPTLPRFVTIRTERLQRPDGGYGWLYLSDDDSALELPAGILPGQRLRLQRARGG